jgi:hypothetical protein
MKDETGGTALERNLMDRSVFLALETVATVCLAAVLGNAAVAQDIHRVSFKTAAADTKYTKQLVLDVGDVPGHQIRLFEIQRTFPNNPPVINGVRIKQIWSRGISDYTNSTGPSTHYSIFEMENGDNVFVHVSSTSQSVANPDGSTAFAATSEGTMTGGTGLFASISGLVRTSTIFNPETGLNEGQTDIEYALADPTDAIKMKQPILPSFDVRPPSGN